MEMDIVNEISSKYPFMYPINYPHEDKIKEQAKPNYNTS